MMSPFCLGGVRWQGRAGAPQAHGPRPPRRLPGGGAGRGGAAGPLNRPHQVHAPARDDRA